MQNCAAKFRAVRREGTEILWKTVQPRCSFPWNQLHSIGLALFAAKLPDLNRQLRLGLVKCLPNKSELRKQIEARR